jgi:predicted TIM-barrel fold metal-dependent hydrolase
MIRAAILLVVAASLLAPAKAIVQGREAIIDVHLHASAASNQGPPPLAMCTPIAPMPSWSQQASYQDEFLALFKKPQCADPIWSPMTDAELMNQTIEAVRRLNVFGVLSGEYSRLDTWLAAEPNRFMPGLYLNVADKTPPSIASIRERHAKGGLRAIAEVTNQYSGVAPDDPRMAPYWQVAEELDLPVGYHIGTGPPGSIYLGATANRARLHSALLLEEVLVKHPKLRVYVMHAGYPMLDDMLTMLYQHPQLHVDVGVIVYTQPRAAFYRYLQALVESGFGKRVMFGSDQMVWPGVIERSIAVINDAPFLSAAQKRDILYNNAARFLRLTKADMARHRGM